jgi:hypothetical protein
VAADRLDLHLRGRAEVLHRDHHHQRGGDRAEAEEEALAKVATEGDDYIDGWNKATNYIRSGGK